MVKVVWHGAETMYGDRDGVAQVKATVYVWDIIYSGISQIGGNGGGSVMGEMEVVVLDI